MEHSDLKKTASSVTSKTEFKELFFDVDEEEEARVSEFECYSKKITDLLDCDEYIPKSVC